MGTEIVEKTKSNAPYSHNAQGYAPLEPILWVTAPNPTASLSAASNGYGPENMNPACLMGFESASGHAVLIPLGIAGSEFCAPLVESVGLGTRKVRCKHEAAGVPSLSLADGGGPDKLRQLDIGMFPIWAAPPPRVMFSSWGLYNPSVRTHQLMRPPTSYHLHPSKHVPQTMECSTLEATICRLSTLCHCLSVLSSNRGRVSYQI
jgi:hypothetical protein